MTVYSIKVEILVETNDVDGALDFIEYAMKQSGVSEKDWGIIDLQNIPKDELIGYEIAGGDY